MQTSQSTKRCLKTALSALDVELHIPLIHAGGFGNWTMVLWYTSLIHTETLLNLLTAYFQHGSVCTLMLFTTSVLGFSWKQSFLFSFLFNLFESWFFDEYLAFLDLVLETRQFLNSEVHQLFLISPGIIGM